MKNIFFASLLLIIGCGRSSQTLKTINGLAQGSTYSITYFSENQLVEKKQIDSIIEVIDLSMSTYREESLISQINQNQPLIIDEHFKKVFLMSKKIHHQSDGFFDPSIGLLIDAWGFGKNEHHNPPNKSTIDSLLLLVGLDKINLTHEDIFQKENLYIQLNFNAIAQGYTCDVIADFLKQKNITNFIVEVGGEMVVSGKNPQKRKAWAIGIDNPLQNPDEPREIIQVLEIQGGLATSGNYRKVWTDSLTGKKYVHTINPKTGYPEQSDLLSATVIAPTAMEADAYATALMAIGLEKSKVFLDNHPELKALLLSFDNTSNEIKISKIRLP